MVYEEKITYKGRYGTVTESIKRVDGIVRNDFTKEEYEVSAPNLAVLIITTQDPVEAGDEIMTTSGEFEVDALSGCYTQMYRDYYKSEVVARFVEFEGDDYIPEKSTNGGGYLHKWWKVEEVKSSNYIE